MIYELPVNIDYADKHTLWSINFKYEKDFWLQVYITLKKKLKKTDIIKTQRVNTYIDLSIKSNLDNIENLKHFLNDNRSLINNVNEDWIYKNIVNNKNENYNIFWCNCIWGIMEHHFIIHNIDFNELFINFYFNTDWINEEILLSNNQVINLIIVLNWILINRDRL